MISEVMIQGGGYTASMVKKGDQKDPIVLQSNNGHSNLRGTVARARTSKFNSAASEFFINHVDNLFLNYSSASPGYFVFGQVVKATGVGMSLRQKPLVISMAMAMRSLSTVQIKEAEIV